MKSVRLFGLVKPLWIGGSLGVLVFVVWFNIECYKGEVDTAAAQRRGEFLLICPAYFAAAAGRSIAASLVPVAAALVWAVRRIAERRRWAQEEEAA